MARGVYSKKGKKLGGVQLVRRNQTAFENNFDEHMQNARKVLASGMGYKEGMSALASHPLTKKLHPRQHHELMQNAGLVDWNRKYKSGQDFNILGHAALPGGHAGYGR
jgi:hypothetical protein